MSPHGVGSWHLERLREEAAALRRFVRVLALDLQGQAGVDAQVAQRLRNKADEWTPTGFQTLKDEMSQKRVYGPYWGSSRMWCMAKTKTSFCNKWEATVLDAGGLMY